MLKISIITVVLNGVKTIERTIESVVNQDYNNIEYIIIDGGSTDGTLDVIEKYGDKIDYWISEPDNGIYSAMNKGLNIASGEYVNFMNSGDWLEESIVKKVVGFINFSHADVLFGDVNRVSKNGLKSLQTALPLDYMYIGLPFCHQSAFVRNYKNVRFDETYKIASDYKMFLELYVQKKKFQYFPYVISNYTSGGVADRNQGETSFEMSMIASTVLVNYEEKARIYGSRVLNDLIQAEYAKRLYNGEYQDGIIEYIDEKIGNNYEIVIFGIGDIYKKYRGLIRNNSNRIKYLVDNDKTKEGIQIDKKTVFLPDILRSENDLAVIIMNERYDYEIRKQLNEMNLSPQIKIYGYRELKTDYKKKMDGQMIDYLCNIYPHIRKLVLYGDSCGNKS